MRRIRLLLALVLLAQVFACGLSNTMYNARNYYRTAFERPLNSNGKPTPQAVEEYTKAIKKCGIIITERKNGKQLEEALFIMAKALYLKGNSSFQAKDQFDNLIRLNPTGKYVPEAYIFQARVLRDVNKPADADALLEGFIRDPRFRKHHPRALLTLAEFEIQDKDYYRAQFWLEKIITEYPKTKEYREAYFLFGKNYYVQEDYQKSLEEFTKISKIRRMDKLLRLDSIYYVGLNQYELGDYAAGLKAVNTVIKTELRPDRLAQAKVLRGRLLIRSGKDDAGKAELEAVLKDYPRTQASASAAYSLGEYYFYTKQDKINALANYTRVKTEFPLGELVPGAQEKSNAITQLNSGNNLDSETKLQQYLDYQYLAAENYFEILDLPDSSFIVYRRIIAEKEVLSAVRDSLNLRLVSVQVTLDSLDLALAVAAPQDSVAMDSTAVAISDSLVTKILPDSIVVDSIGVASAPAIDRASLEKKRSSLVPEKLALTSRLDNLNAALERFDREIIPFVWFCMANYQNKLGHKDPEVAQILSYLQENFPANKYTNAVRMLYNDENVRIIDPAEEQVENEFDYALGLDATASLDSMKTILEQISTKGNQGMQLRANFRLGWLYSIEKADTISAKAYFDAVLKDTNSGDYGILVRRLYDGKKFLIYNVTPEIDTTSAVTDSLGLMLPADSLAVSDSLVNGDSLSVSDSLQVQTDEPKPKEDNPKPDISDTTLDNEEVPPALKEGELIPVPEDQPPNPQEDTKLE